MHIYTGIRWRETGREGELEIKFSWLIKAQTFLKHFWCSGVVYSAIKFSLPASGLPFLNFVISSLAFFKHFWCSSVVYSAIKFSLPASRLPFLNFVISFLEIGSKCPAKYVASTAEDILTKGILYRHNNGDSIISVN